MLRYQKSYKALSKQVFLVSPDRSINEVPSTCCSSQFQTKLSIQLMLSRTLRARWTSYSKHWTIIRLEEMRCSENGLRHIYFHSVTIHKDVLCCNQVRIDGAIPCTSSLWRPQQLDSINKLWLPGEKPWYLAQTSFFSAFALYIPICTHSSWMYV